MRDKDRLVFIECKHCHETIIGTSNFVSIIAKTFDNGFEFAEEVKLQINLARTYYHLIQDQLIKSGTGESTTSIVEKIAMIEKGLRCCNNSGIFGSCILVLLSVPVGKK